MSVRLPAPAHEAPLPPARPGAYGTRVLPGVPLFLRERLHV
ncbi:hypothetical protein [Microbispora sp. H10836]|nr:hypothetical protein [Microbispora sp. H10836]